MSLWPRTLRKWIKFNNTCHLEAFPSTRETWWLVDHASELSLPSRTKVMPQWYYTWSHDLAAPISGKLQTELTSLGAMNIHSTFGGRHSLRQSPISRWNFAPIHDVCTVFFLLNTECVVVIGESWDNQSDCISNISKILITAASFDVSLILTISPGLLDRFCQTTSASLRRCFCASESCLCWNLVRESIQPILSWSWQARHCKEVDPPASCWSRLIVRARKSPLRYAYQSWQAHHSKEVDFFMRIAGFSSTCSWDLVLLTQQSNVWQLASANPVLGSDRQICIT